MALGCNGPRVPLVVPKSPETPARLEHDSRDPQNAKAHSELVEVGRALTSQVQTPTRAPHETGPAAHEGDSEPNVRRDTPLELARREIRNQVIQGFSVDQVPALLDAMLSEQPSNAAWTRAVTDEIALAIERTGDEKSELKEVNCGDKFCKIVTTHGSSAEARQFWHEAEGNDELGGPRQRFSKPLSAEQVMSTTYMAVRGHDENIHEALYDRMYKELTSKEAGDIQPSEEQLARVAAGGHLDS